MAPSGGFVETSAAGRAITGFRRMVPFSTRSTGTPRNWWGTPLSQMARWRRLPVSPFPTTARRAWRDSDSGLTGPAMYAALGYVLQFGRMTHAAALRAHKSLFQYTLGCHDAEITTRVLTYCYHCFDRRSRCCFH